jgi:hypothetical protein
VRPGWCIGRASVNLAYRQIIELGGYFNIKRADNFSAYMLAVMGSTAKALQVELQPINVRGPADFESAFSAWADKAGGLVTNDHKTYNAKAIAAKQRILGYSLCRSPRSAGSWATTWIF